MHVTDIKYFKTFQKKIGYQIKDLITAYEFAESKTLSEENCLEAHRIFSKTLLIKSKQGQYRKEPVGVFSSQGLVYLAVEPEFVSEKMSELFDGIDTLLEMDLNPEQIFYHAALIHLRFAHIHPFRDGNGRAARLLEKWFLAEKMGRQFWQLQSEAYYKNHKQEYYQTLNLGIHFYELNYDRSIDFLVMLPSCLK